MRRLALNIINPSIKYVTSEKAYKIVIPACFKRESRSNIYVITQASWIPAFAGMTPLAAFQLIKYCLVTLSLLFMLFLPSIALCETDNYYKVSILSLYKPIEVTVSFDAIEPLVLQIDGKLYDEYFISNGSKFNISLAPLKERQENPLESKIVISIVSTDGTVHTKKIADLKSIISFVTKDTKKTYNKYTIEVNGKSKIKKDYEGILEIRHLYGDFLVLLSIRQADVIIDAVESKKASYTLPEALKVQVVLTQTELSLNERRHAMAGYNFCDTNHCQFYKEHGQSDASVIQALKDTKDEVITYDGKLIQPYDFDTCGGYTALPSTIWGDDDNRFPYLKPVKCDYCSDSKLYRYSSSFQRDTLSQIFFGKDDPNFDVKVTKNDLNNHWVDSVTISGTGNEYPLKAERFVNLINGSLGKNSLPSGSFTIKREVDTFIFNGKGMGHGVGLCVSGADKMAKSGQNYKEIIKFYFAGVKVEKREKQ